MTVLHSSRCVRACACVCVRGACAGETVANLTLRGVEPWRTARCKQTQQWLRLLCPRCVHVRTCCGLRTGTMRGADNVMHGYLDQRCAARLGGYSR